MTHNPVHALYFVFGVLYFVLAFYFVFKNYLTTKHDGFWFFLLLFTFSMTGVMVAGALSSAQLADPNNIHAYYDTFFLMASIFLFTAAYTLHKEHHKIKVF
jgi:hypothetical protein